MKQLRFCEKILKHMVINVEIEKQQRMNYVEGDDKMAIIYKREIKISIRDTAGILGEEECNERLDDLINFLKAKAEYNTVFVEVEK